MKTQMSVTLHSQLAILEFGVNRDFEFTEEVAALFPVKATARTSGLKESVIGTLHQLALNLTILSGVTTDVSSEMAGR
jgi:hypothetical protein